MSAVGEIDLFSPQQTPREREGRVEDEMKQQHRDDVERQTAEIEIRADDGKRRKGKSQKGAAHIAHENPGGRKIEKQETPGAREQHVRAHIYEDALLLKCDCAQERRRNDGDPS